MYWRGIFCKETALFGGSLVWVWRLHGVGDGCWSLVLLPLWKWLDASTRFHEPTWPNVRVIDIIASYILTSRLRLFVPYPETIHTTLCFFGLLSYLYHRYLPIVVVFCIVQWPFALYYYNFDCCKKSFNATTKTPRRALPAHARLLRAQAQASPCFFAS